jgi:general L-amino acid transport system permease protein
VLLALAWLWFVPGADVLAVGPGFEPVESRLLGGFMLALIIGVSGIVMSLPIGILLALGRRSDLFFIKTLCIVFIEFIRGVPLITLLFVANSVLAYLFPPGSNLDLILRVVIMVTIFASAYMAEVIRGGLAALPSGQYEAADSLGLDYWKSMRLIILPQALKVSIPNIVSAFIGLFKDTTLVVVIGLMDPIGLIGNIRADSNWNGIVWELFFFVGLFFFLACFGMSRYSQYLERKLATGHR